MQLGLGVVEEALLGLLGDQHDVHAHLAHGGPVGLLVVGAGCAARLGAGWIGGGVGLGVRRLAGMGGVVEVESGVRRLAGWMQFC
jgi:hypothetical protein